MKSNVQFHALMFISVPSFNASKPKFGTCGYKADVIAVDAIQVKEVSIDLFHYAVLC